MLQGRKKRRARYLDDPGPAFDGNDRLHAGRPNEQQDEWSAYTFVPAAPYDPMQDDEWADHQPQPVQKRPPRPRENPLWRNLALIMLALLLLMAFGIYRFQSPNAAFQKQKALLAQDTFFPGIYVDNMPLEGMTYQQARQALGQHDAHQEKDMALPVEVDGKKWLITSQEVPFKRNIDSVLNKAYAIGRKGFPWVAENGQTPFNTRYLHTQQTKRDKAFFSTGVTYSAKDVRRVAEEISGQINREAVNAVISTFDFNTRAFTVTKDVPGAKLDTEELYTRLTQALNRGDYTSQVLMYSQPIMPIVTSVELQNGFALLSTFTTNTGSNQNRNVNISLAAKAINGTALMPGESFSFNRTTGERTTDKGYLPAPAIADGTTFDEPGGGVCQVSTTLFNAAAMADMTITIREPHAWPVTYVDKGLDATVNWPNLDFQFRNDKKTPVFIVASYQDKKLTVEMYGMRLGNGESIKLETELVSTTQPPQEPKHEQNPSLPPGFQQEKRQARTGYLVNTYRVYLRNGQEIRRETLCTSNYRAIQQVIEFN